MIGAVSAIALRGASLYATAEMVGLNIDYAEAAQMFLRIGRTALKIQRRAHAIDVAALEEMVSLARERVPKRTGYLEGNIKGQQDGDWMEFSALSPRADTGVDYGPFVERGTRPGVRGQRVATPTFYEQAAGQRRKARRTHPGTEAQPFFWNTAREVLERRGRDLAASYAADAESDSE